MKRSNSKQLWIWSGSEEKMEYKTEGSDKEDHYAQKKAGRV